MNTPEFKDLTTRKELAEILKVEIRTISNYHRLALRSVDDYLEAFPKVFGQPVTTFKLSAYQCWVIWKLQTAIATLKNSELVAQTLINDLTVQKQFSLVSYKESINEYQTISG